MAEQTEYIRHETQKVSVTRLVAMDEPTEGVEAAVRSMYPAVWREVSEAFGSGGEFYVRFLRLRDEPDTMPFARRLILEALVAPLHPIDNPPQSGA